MSRFRPISVWQIARMTFALAGGLLFILLALPSSAQAGCGDYVFVRNASGQLVRASTLMKDHGDGDCTGPNCHESNRPLASKNQVPVSSETSLPIKLPCQGPNCSGRSVPPAVPIPPPAPSQSVQESTALLLAMNDGEPEAGARFSGARSDHDLELHYPQSIFHPPREALPQRRILCAPPDNAARWRAQITLLTRAGLLRMA